MRPAEEPEGQADREAVSAAERSADLAESGLAVSPHPRQEASASLLHRRGRAAAREHGVTGLAAASAAASRARARRSDRERLGRDPSHQRRSVAGPRVVEDDEHARVEVLGDLHDDRALRERRDIGARRGGSSSPSFRPCRSFPPRRRASSRSGNGRRPSRSSRRSRRDGDVGGRGRRVADGRRIVPLVDRRSRR